jgi:transcriptional regulator, propionate catabolism operon regulatory protein
MTTVDALLPLSGPRAGRSAVPRIVAVGYRRINKMLRELAPAFASNAQVDVLDVGFDQAVTRIRQLQASQGVDVVVAAGSNGAYLRQHLDTPVVLVKVGGFDLMRALAHARQLLGHTQASVGLVTYQGMSPDLSPYAPLLQVGVVQRSYQSEDEAHWAVQSLKEEGVQVVVGTGTVADQADALGMQGVFLYSMDAVRSALDDALEVARAARIELAKRERLGTILTQLSDGVIAVDLNEHIETLNPTMAHWLNIEPAQWQGKRLTELCAELSLLPTLRQGQADLDRIEQVRGKTLIVNRMPILEQGRLTGAVLTCQDPIRIQRVDRHIRTRTKSAALGAKHELSTFLGEGAAATQLREQARQCARSQATVLLVGESGTGKELIAQGIHQASDRRDMPFVAINCAAMTETLLESELFGYEEGAFTGARRGGKMGLFEAAHNGTLFLDEVGEMPMALQSRLLRVLQAREVLRVGATDPTPVNVRILAATHRDLPAHVDKGLFRLDLLYRLDILRLNVPPLRERMDDFDCIATALHQRICARLGVPLDRSVDLLKSLVLQAPGYHWPGNVRQLENLLERCIVLGVDTSNKQDASDVVLYRLMPELRSGQLPPHLNAPVPASLQARAHMEAVLFACQGDRAAAAKQLGISRTTLWRKLKGA